MTTAAKADPFEWTITMATRGYHVRRNGQIVQHFYDLATCGRFIARAKLETRT